MDEIAFLNRRTGQEAPENRLIHKIHTF